MCGTTDSSFQSSNTLKSVYCTTKHC